MNFTPFVRCSRCEPMQALLLTLALASCAVASGCQNQDDHAPFAAGCQTDCKPSPGISIGSGSAAGGSSAVNSPDAGFDAGTLTGNVLALADDSFSRAAAFTQSASVSATGSSGGAVSATWNGTAPYQLSGVAVADTNWILVSPANPQGDALPTLQAVQTDATDTADLFVVDTAVIDSVLTAVSASRAPAFGQVVLFFRNAGTGASLSGVRADMAPSAAQVSAYAAASGWVLEDDTTTTSASGLVVFGNVTLPTGASTTQTVTVSRPATATTTAISGGQFSVKVVGGAVTLATIGVKL